MARKEVGGVRGVLGGLISDAPHEQTPPKQSPVSRPDAGPPPKPSPTSRPSKGTRARLGRPPGRQPGKTPPKEKITVRIDVRLAALYRDWSWDERCQLGELVERALRAYHDSKL